MPPATTAGHPLTLTCTVTIIENLVVPPVLEWLDPDGFLITMATGDPSVGETVVTGPVSTNVLSFQSVLPSHRGQYSCKATINIPTLPPVETTQTTNVTVLGKVVYAF